MKWTCLAVAASIVVGSMVLHAQSSPRPRPGRVEQIKVHGKSLEGNLEGDSPDRDVTVYLPPSYNTDRTRRYPVVYLLHGYGGTDANWTGRQANVPESADRLAAAGGFHEMIVVMPNAFTLHKGSMYSNSVTTGDWETYIARDLVSYVDDHYRTLVGRASRGLTLYRAGLRGAQSFLAENARGIGEVEGNEARRCISASDSSTSTWLDSNSPLPFSISYYSQGRNIAALLDLSIRHDTNGARGPDDVMRALDGQGLSVTDEGYRAVDLLSRLGSA